MADKLLSITKLDKIIKQEKCAPVNTIKYEIDGDIYEITVKNHISFSEILSFVDGVVASIFPFDDDNQQHYFPAILEYAKATHYIEFFTNLKEKLGSDRVFDMLYASGIMHAIYRGISPAQYHAIEDAIDSAISHKLAVLQTGEQAKIKTAIQEIEKATAALKVLGDQFSGVGEDEMRSALERLTSITTEDLAKGIVAAREPD